MAAGAGEASSLALGLIFGAAKIAKDVRDQRSRSRRCKALNVDRVDGDKIKITIIRQQSKRRNYSIDLRFNLSDANADLLRQSLIKGDRKAANIIL